MKIKKMIFLIILMTWQSVFGQTTGPDADYTYASRLYMDQMYELAAVQFREYADQYAESPRAPEALKLAGDSYVKIDQFENARIQYMTLLFKYPDAPGLDEIQYKIGQCFEKEGNYIKAAHSYQQLKSLYPRSKLSEDIFYKAAQMYVMGKEYSSAIELYYLHLDANDQGETSLKARHELARTFVEMEDYERALNEIDKILSRSQAGQLHINSLLTKAEIMYNFGRIRDAEVLYEQILTDYKARTSSYPNEITKARLELATISRTKGKYKHSNEILAAGSTDIMDEHLKDRLYLLMGDNYYDLEQFDDAVQKYRSIGSEVDKDRSDALLKLGSSYRQAGQLDEAISVFEALLARCDTIRLESEQLICQETRYEIAQAWLQKGQSPNALYHLNQYVVQYPQGPCSDIVRFKIAEIYSKESDNPERALRLYYEFTDQFPTSRLVDDAQLAVARCYEEMKDYSRALDAYNYLSTKFPASSHEEVAAKRIKYIENYLVTTDTKAVDGFITLLGELIQNSDNQRLSFMMAKTYYEELKDYERALDLLKIAEKQKENSAILDEIEYYKGNCYRLLAEKEWLDSGGMGSLQDSCFGSYRRVIATWPSSKWSQEASFQMIKFDSILKRSDDERYAYLQDALSRFINDYPQSAHRVEADYLLGKSYYHADKTDTSNAIYHFQAVVNRDNQGRFLTDALYHIASIYKNRNMLNQAQDLFTRIIDDPNNDSKRVAAIYERAKIRRLLQDDEGAKKDFETIIDQYFYSPLADSSISQIGDIYEAAGQYSQGIDFFRELEADHISHCRWSDAADQLLVQEVYFRKGQLFSFVGDKKKAIDNLQSYLKKFPGDRYTPDILMNLAELYRSDHLQDREIAVNYLQQLIAEYPDYDRIGQAHISAGDLFFANNDHQAARRHYLAGIEAAPNDTTRLYATSQAIICLYLMDQISAADQEMKQFKKDYDEIDEYLGRIELARGNYYFKQKEFELAEETYKSARSKFKHNKYGPRAEFALGRLYLTLNRDDDAMKILTEMPGKYPNHPVLADVYLALGEFYYMKARQVENAMLAYKNAIEQPLISDASLARGISNLIRCYFDLQMWDQVLVQSRAFLDKFPLSEHSFEVRIQIGITYFYLHEYDRAIDYLRKLKYEADYENEPRIQYWIGDCYMEKGHYEKAIAEYLKVKYISKPTKLNWAVTAQYKAGVAYMKLGKMDIATQIFKKIIVEQGAASPFGKGAQKKLDEIGQVN
ncbi:tetratricopeptide repeat protein [candidate division KSB1 bacterium]|nr:tetratricopeptide repeat protein [candidate division KSB1 bacterium]